MPINSSELPESSPAPDADAAPARAVQNAAASASQNADTQTSAAQHTDAQYSDAQHPDTHTTENPEQGAAENRASEPPQSRSPESAGTESTGPEGEGRASETDEGEQPRKPALTALERAMIDLEKRRWKYQGAKEKAITELGLTPIAYYQKLNTMIDNQRVIAAEPILMHRLRAHRDRTPYT